MKQLRIVCNLSFLLRVQLVALEMVMVSTPQNNVRAFICI